MIKHNENIKISSNVIMQLEKQLITEILQDSQITESDHRSMLENICRRKERI